MTKLAFLAWVPLGSGALSANEMSSLRLTFSLETEMTFSDTKTHNMIHASFTYRLNLDPETLNPRS